MVLFGNVYGPLTRYVNNQMMGLWVNFPIRLRLRLRQVYSTKIYTSTISGLHEFLRNTNNTIVLIYKSHRHVGRPPLRSYLTAGMEATRKGKACAVVMDAQYNVMFNWWQITNGWLNANETRDAASVHCGFASFAFNHLSTGSSWMWH